MNKCRFCEIINNNSERENEEIVFENDEFIVLTDTFRQTSVGAICLIITKKHKQNLLELTEESGRALIHTINLVSRSMQKAYDCNGIRVWSAINSEAGQSIFHCHIHLVPCKSFWDRMIASFPGIYDLICKVLKLGNTRTIKKTNYYFAEKIRKHIKV